MLTNFELKNWYLKHSGVNQLFAETSFHLFKIGHFYTFSHLKRPFYRAKK
jgi:hypothetical protein